MYLPSICVASFPLSLLLTVFFFFLSFFLSLLLTLDEWRVVVSCSGRKLSRLGICLAEYSTSRWIYV